MNDFTTRLLQALRKEIPMNEISNAELAKRIDILRDKVNALEKQISAATAQDSKATKRKKLDGQLNGQDVWVYDVTGAEFKEDKNEPGRMITFVTTKNGKNIPVDEHGIVVFDDQYDLIRDFADSLAK